MHTQSKQSSSSRILTLFKHSSTLSVVNPSCSRIPYSVATLAITLSSGS